jgi:F-type H+-transporting ATPase subunit epsilon
MVVTTPNLKCVIVTPDAKVASENVYEIVLPAHDGLLGILPGHAPLLCKLGTGLLRYHNDMMEEKVFFIDGGFAHVREDEVMILTSRTVAKGGIATADAERQLRVAETMSMATLAEVEERARAIQRAKSLIALSRMPAGPVRFSK